METIILKTILCSGVLLGLYHLFLAKEKTFIFNRFYLISALIFSFSIPFAAIETKQTEKEIPETVFAGEIAQPILQASIVKEESFDFTEILIIASFIISGILLLKIVYSVFKIKRLKGRKIIYRNRNVFLLKQNLAPFSFCNTIYLSENYFKDSKIDNAIFFHEEIHVKQKHSVDILFVEILKAVFWFNPFIYFYKKAMINNHEFIADESVILKNKNVKKYQEFILQEILKQQNLALIHQFNFNNTKKRFIMMTSKNSKFAKAKKMMVIPIFIITGFAFAERVHDKSIAINTIDSQSKNHPESKNFARKHNAEKKVITSFTTDHKEFSNLIKNDTITPQKKADKKINDEKSLNEKSSETVADIFFEDVKNTVDIPAEYPGGANKLRSLVASNFDGSIMKGDEGILKSVIYFNVDENGKVDNFNANGENEKFNTEALRVVKLANQDAVWKPAQKDGQATKYRYQIPLTMNFETYKKTQ